MKKYLASKLVLFILLTGCGDSEFVGQYPTDNIPPGPVTSPTVENVAGGAIIRYNIPDDDDFLYVKAIYNRHGETVEQKASAYNNSLLIEGFGKSASHTIQLIAYDRSNNASTPVNVTIEPKDAAIYEVRNTLVVREDFGGIRLDWINSAGTDAVVEVITTGQEYGIDELVEAETFYSKAKTGGGNVRGYLDEERLFGVFVRDRWGNRTDTLMGNYVPIYETQLDKSKFVRWNPPGIPYNGYTTVDWRIENLWDNQIGTRTSGNGRGWATLTSLQFTFDMGQRAKLSRFKINQRPEANLIYSLGHPRKFQLWGSPHPNVNADFSTWILLGEFESIKPSGLPLGSVSDEDIDYAWQNGEDWDVPLDAPPIRYIRFVAQETWGQASAVQVMEMTLWGDNKY